MYILDAEFWEALWKRSRSRSSSLKDVKGFQEYPVEKWNRRAASYSRQTHGHNMHRRWQSVHDFLKYCSVDLQEGMEVLDIGSGPGNFAIPFARMGLKVWALDPAENMLAILKERISKEKLEGIFPVGEGWETIDLEKEGWVKKFDLVFASMSPGVNSKETLQKMISASKKYCYISSFAGSRVYPLQEEISRELLGDEYKVYTPEIIYPFNMLYSMGYYAKLTFEKNDSEREVALEDVFVEIVSHLGLYTEITPDIEEKVKSFLQARANNGLVVKKTSSSIGMMLWEV
ncbi:MAG: class I SAM-dependent methyltransferase [Bacillota bacterium]